MRRFFPVVFLIVLAFSTGGFASEEQGFDYLAYLSANSDLPSDWGKAECMNHYKLYGFGENRVVTFELEEYLNANPDLPANWILADALNHYNMYGKFENRRLAFGAQEYLSLYSDLPQDWSYDQAYAHYNTYGQYEGRVASFDEVAYLEMYSDLPGSWGQEEAFYHYIAFGQYEGRAFDPYDEGGASEDNMASGDSVSGNMIGFSSNEEMVSYLKDQYLKSVHSDYPLALDTLSVRENGSMGNAVDGSDDASVSLPSSDSISYTGTNLQEANVDESDLVKTNGEFMFVASGEVVNIVRVADPMSLIKQIDIANTVDALYLYDDLLIVIYSPAGYGGSQWIDSGMENIDTIGIPYWIPIEVKVGIAFYDVSNPSSPSELKQVEMDGYLVASRRIDNVLYIVQQFLPDLPSPYVLEEEIEDMSLESLIPFYTTTGEKRAEDTPAQLVAAEDFYHPEIDGGGSIVSIMAFDLDDPDFSFESTGVVADASTVYASTEALYFTSTYWNYKYSDDGDPRQQTVVYKFSLSGDQLTGEGYTSVNGRLLNQFSMGEYEGVLRIATTTGWSWRSDGEAMNHVYCLSSENGSLEVIGRLEDLAPGEEIYAARFIGPRGFLVTYVTIDPLFTLDLSDPAAPAVAGELKVPGYSNYIHPIGDNHLLCIGKDAVEEDGFAWYQGVKLTLFDITDFSNPAELYTVDIGDRGTNSEALYNHKAFTFWEDNGLLAIPVDLYEHLYPPEYPYTYGDFVFKGLYVYEVTVSNGFDFLGRIATTDDLDEYYYHNASWTRGIFVDDTVYAVTPGAVFSAQADNINSTAQLEIEF